MGTKIKVGVLTKEGYSASKQTKVKAATGSVESPYYIWKTNNYVKVKVWNGKKGDKVEVAIAGKTYSNVVKKSVKEQYITVKTGTHSAGSSVRINLYDKFRNRKDSVNDMVYYGSTIYKGMSVHNLPLTIWGEPTSRNDYGFGSIQWVFRNDNSYLYAYVSGGVVTDIQRINF